MIAPRSHFECLINVMFNDNGKIVFKNIEPTKKELSKLQIPKKDAIEHEHSINSDDDFQDPPPRKINEHSKKKQKVDSSTPVAKRPLRKKQVVDIEDDKLNVDEGGLEQSGQHFSPDVVQSSNNISDGTKQQHVDKNPVLQNMDYVGTERSPQRLSSEVNQELEANFLGKKGCTDFHFEKINVEIDSQQLIPDELLRSINLNYLHSKKVVQHDCRASDEKIDETILSDSQFTIPDKIGHYAAVLAEIEKIAMIIPLCLQDCDFYVKKGIDLQNHPRYKDKESTDMFDVLFEDDLPQQLSGSLDCGVFMIMYAEYLSYGHKFIATEFNPNALRTRYAALLWDYGIRKQEANAISDVEVPLRPVRQSRITSVTEVVDV
ncbi:hypothetical protein T459_01915 [Capsicum annuum]|uniref:Ubiquitin-like protease family profile domain-containing protein n=1 Tax=Capsicum annuum TaxID=4072 RepID=A0A2G3AIN4_CAPAN|nr:hypothetical protein T459_01915 [Capsicum annuum]